MKYYIGLDVSMKRTFICVLDQDGKIIYEGSEFTDPHAIVDHLFLNNHLPKINLKDVLIGFESGSLSHYLMEGFLERSIPAVCIYSLQWKIRHVG